LLAKPIRLTAHQGRASEVLVNYDERFLREVEKALLPPTAASWWSTLTPGK
jgi:hypothetical protein